MTFFEKLANSSTSSVGSSDHLKLLGKQAARLYMDKEAESLTEAVQKVADDEDLTREQVSRVAETANQETWRSMFVEQGVKDVQFEPADVGQVIGELATKPDVVSDQSLSMLDYMKDVPNQTLPEGIDLMEAFGVKKDTPEYEALNPTKAAEDTVEKVAAAADLSRYGADKAAGALAEVGEAFYEMVKQAHLKDGLGLLQISKAVASVMYDPAFATDVMQKVAARLQAEGVKFNETEELKKIAHPLVVNTEHPLMEMSSRLEHTAFAYYSAEDNHEKLAAAHQRAVGLLRAKVRKG